MKYFTYIFLITMICGCGDKTTTKNKFVEEKNDRNHAIVNSLIYENLGVQLNYVEKLFSLTAYSKENGSSTYKIGDCLISLSMDKHNNIKSAGIFLDDKCVISLPFEGKAYQSDSMTFEKIIGNEILSGEFRIRCYDCGNAANPRLEYFVPGVHANDSTSYAYELESREEWYVQARQHTAKLDKFPQYAGSLNLSVSVDSDLGKILMRTLKQAKLTHYSITKEAAESAESEIWESTDCAINKSGFVCTEKR